MSEYNPEIKKVEEAIQQVYRDFALKYDEIQKSKLSESEKQAQISELFERTSNTEEILRKTRSLAYRQRLIAMGKKSLGELDEELTGLQEKEQQAKELCEQYEQQMPDKSHQEI